MTEIADRAVHTLARAFLIMAVLMPVFALMWANHALNRMESDHRKAIDAINRSLTEIQIRFRAVEKSVHDHDVRMKTFYDSLKRDPSFKAEPEVIP